MADGIGDAQKYDKSNLDGERKVEVPDCIDDTQMLDGESKVEESNIVKMNSNENKVADGINDAQMFYRESEVEEKLTESFKQIAADAILMMSNDCDVLTSVSVSLMTEILMIWSNQVLN